MVQNGGYICGVEECRALSRARRLGRGGGAIQIGSVDASSD